MTHSFTSPPLLAPQEFCQALQQPDAKVFKNYLKVGIWKMYVSSYNQGMFQSQYILQHTVSYCSLTSSYIVTYLGISALKPASKNPQSIAITTLQFYVKALSAELLQKVKGSQISTLNCICLTMVIGKSHFLLQFCDVTKQELENWENK